MSDSDEESSSSPSSSSTVSDSSESTSSSSDQVSSSSSSSSNASDDSTSQNETTTHDDDDTSRKSESASSVVEDSLHPSEESGSSSSSDDDDMGESGWSSVNTSSEEDCSSDDDADEKSEGDEQSVVSTAMSVESVAFSVGPELRDIPWVDVSNTPKPLVQTALPDAPEASESSEFSTPSKQQVRLAGATSESAPAERRSPTKRTKPRKTKLIAAKVAAGPPAATEKLRKGDTQRTRKVRATSTKDAASSSAIPLSEDQTKSTTKTKPTAKTRKAKAKAPTEYTSATEKKRKPAVLPITEGEKQSSEAGVSAQGDAVRPRRTSPKKTNLQKPKAPAQIETRATASIVEVENEKSIKRRPKKSTSAGRSGKRSDSASPVKQKRSVTAQAPMIATSDADHQSHEQTVSVDDRMSPKESSEDEAESKPDLELSPEKHDPSESYDDVEPLPILAEDCPKAIHQPLSESNVSSFYGLPGPPLEEPPRQETAPPRPIYQKERDETKFSPEYDIQRRRKMGLVIAIVFTTVVFSFVFAMAMVILTRSGTLSDQTNGPDTLPAPRLPLCNGYSNLCKVRLDDQLFAIVDAASSSSSGRLRRLNSIDSNLASGYRGFRLSLSWCETVLQVGGCTSGISAIIVLESLVTFLTSNRLDFVLLLIERSEGVTMDDVANLLWSVRGVTEKMYAYPGNASPWPLLETVLDRRQQLLVFENSALRSLCVTCPAGVHSWQEFTTTTNLPLIGGTASQAGNCELTGNPKDFVAVYGPSVCHLEEEPNLLDLHYQACEAEGHVANFLFVQNPCPSVLELVMDENSAKDITTVSWFPLLLQLTGVEGELNGVQLLSFERSCRNFFSENIPRGTNMDCLIDSQHAVGSSTNIQVRVSTDSPISGEGLEVITLTDTLAVHSSDFVASLRASLVVDLESIEVLSEWVTPRPTVATAKPTSAPSPSSAGVAVRLPEFFTESPVLPGAVRLPDGLV